MAPNAPSAHERLARLFGEPVTREPEAGPAATRRRRRRAIATAVVVALVAGGVVFVVARKSGPSYRTAVVGPRGVASELTAVGTIEPVSQSAVAFPVAGTVASV